MNKTGSQGNTDIGFAHTLYSVLGTKGEVTVSVSRGGDLRAAVLVEYETRDCSVTTVAHKDYEPLTGTLQFRSGEQTKEITIKLQADDDDNEMSDTASVVSELTGTIRKHTSHSSHASTEDDSFIVVLTAARFAKDEGNAKVILGNDEAVVSIVDSETSRGVLNMACAVYKILESQPTVEVKVLRAGGAKGEVSCSYATKDGTAVAPADYTAMSGTLKFAAGETEKIITVTIVDDEIYEQDEDFYMVITDAVGGAKIGATYRSTITIVNDDDLKGTATSTSVWTIGRWEVVGCVVDAVVWWELVWCEWWTVVCGNFDISLDHREMGGGGMCGGCGGVVRVGVVRVVVWWTVVCGNFDISLDHFARAIPPYTAPARAV